MNLLRVPVYGVESKVHGGNSSMETGVSQTQILLNLHNHNIKKVKTETRIKVYFSHITIDV